MSAPNFAERLSKPADEIKRPPTLPAGTYYGVVNRQEFGQSSQKKTDFCRYHLSITGPGDDIDLKDIEGIDLGKRQLRMDFYMTDDAEYRLVEFLKSVGVQTSGRTLGELIPEAINAQVIMAVTLEMGQNNEPFNQVRNMRGRQ